MCQHEDMSEVDARMRALEKQWFMAATEAKSARSDLDAMRNPTERAQALRRLEAAECEKRRLIAEIEALEESLIECE